MKVCNLVTMVNRNYFIYNFNLFEMYFITFMCIVYNNVNTSKFDIIKHAEIFSDSYLRICDSFEKREDC